MAVYAAQSPGAAAGPNSRPFFMQWPTSSDTLRTPRRQSLADALTSRVPRAAAVAEIARAFLCGAGLTVPGELARVTGLARPEAGLGNRALVAEGFAESPARGVYRLSSGPAAPFIPGNLEKSRA